MAGPIATFIVCLSELNAMNQSEKRAVRQVTNSSICSSIYALRDTIRLGVIIGGNAYTYNIHILRHNESYIINNY